MKDNRQDVHGSRDARSVTAYEEHWYRSLRALAERRRQEAEAEEEQEREAARSGAEDVANEDESSGAPSVEGPPSSHDSAGSPGPRIWVVPSNTSGA